MRFKANSVLLALVAVFAMSAVTAAAASAVKPEFKPVPAKKKFTSTSGGVRWAMGTESITCSSSTIAGEIASATLLGKVVVKFTGCKDPGASKSGCAISSLGAKEGEVVTKALKGELGTVKTSEAASGVGLLLEPETKSTGIATIEKTECRGETRLIGSLAAEIPTIGKKQSTNGLVFGVTGGKSNIDHITLDSGKEMAPSLEGWGTQLTVEMSDALTFEEALEVT
jgi:hypothetical protein